VLVPHLKNIYFGQEKSQKINKQTLKKTGNEKMGIELDDYI